MEAVDLAAADFHEYLRGGPDEGAEHDEDNRAFGSHHRLDMKQSE
jgi:hypothetical protein